MRHAARLIVLLVLGLAALWPAAASATDVGPQDGNTYGGSSYRLQCNGNGNNQSFLYGMSGMIGAWVDRVGAECADWVPGQGWSNAFNARSHTGTVGTSTGGGPQSAICPPGTAVKGFRYTFAVPDRTYMQNITLFCVDPLAPNDVRPENPELRSDNGDLIIHHAGMTFNEDLSNPNDWPRIDCPGNQIATGIEGGAGTFVDWIGLICGDPPSPPAGLASGGSNRPIHTHFGSAATQVGAAGGSSGGPAPAAGSWSASCTDGSVYQNVLTAKCKSTTGLEVTSSLDLTTCNPPPAAANINGKLVCENGAAGSSSSGGGYGGASGGGYGGGGIEGNWQTSEGPMTLDRDGADKLTGTYAQDSGRIKLHREGGNFWKGGWSEGSSDHRCHDEKMGSHYWGHVELTFTNGNRHFDGQWQYCGDPTFSKPWTGDRVP